jgi:apolipoprotein N-acyltransferase
MVSSLIPAVVATLGAIAMALAFPRTNAIVLAPVGAAGLLWAWFGMSPKRAFWTGWLAGTVYFGITFWWFGETAGALIAPFGFLLAMGPAIGDAFFGFGLTGALVAFIAPALGRRERAVRALVPLASAAIFAFGEWFRSEGLGEIGVPFGSLGYTQVASPLRAVGAYAGTYGVTFAICIVGAYAAYALRMRHVRGSVGDAAAALGTLAFVVALAWAFWPARSLPAPAFPIAAIQGNIEQGLKFAPGALDRAVSTYESMTLEAAAATHPKLIVWPETVIPVNFEAAPQLRDRFAALARTAHAELVVGSYAVDANGEFNILAFFRPDGTFERVYRKRQLVPFAEHIPFRPLFAWIPWMNNVSNFSEGSRDEVVPVGGLRVAPIVCWESAFSELNRAAVRDGADVLIVATDDAWFGTTAGPYQHAQIAQMRAIETGRYIVRAASTGISGIVAPDGTYATHSMLDQRTIVAGDVGSPVRTVYDAVGAPSVAAMLAALYIAFVALVAFVAGRGRT